MPPKRTIPVKSEALFRVIDERKRQEKKGYTAEHDDGLLLSRSAGSVGKYFMKNVRGRFESVKVEK